MVAVGSKFFASKHIRVERLLDAAELLEGYRWFSRVEINVRLIQKKFVLLRVSRFLQLAELLRDLLDGERLRWLLHHDCVVVTVQRLRVLTVIDVLRFGEEEDLNQDFLEHIISYRARVTLQQLAHHLTVVGLGDRQFKVDDEVFQIAESEPLRLTLIVIKARQASGHLVLCRIMLEQLL